MIAGLADDPHRAFLRRLRIDRDKRRLNGAILEKMLEIANVENARKWPCFSSLAFDSIESNLQGRRASYGEKRIVEMGPHGNCSFPLGHRDMAQFRRSPW